MSCGRVVGPAKRGASPVGAHEVVRHRPRRRLCSRDGATLSAVIRQAWDTGNLASLTRNAPLKATGAHISIVGHVTADELRRELHSTDIANGFANRFMWIVAKRSKELPDGGRPDLDALRRVAERVCRSVEHGRACGHSSGGVAL